MGRREKAGATSLSTYMRNVLYVRTYVRTCTTRLDSTRLHSTPLDLTRLGWGTVQCVVCAVLCYAMICYDMLPTLPYLHVGKYGMPRSGSLFRCGCVDAAAALGSSRSSSRSSRKGRRKPHVGSGAALLGVRAAGRFYLCARYVRHVEYCTTYLSP